MRTRLAVLLAVSAAVTFGQWNRGGGREQTIRANIRGGGGDGGKCTAEVEVDGAAEVMISGDTGRIRTLSGQPAVWRRLDCTAPMPRNPADFRFSGVDGRGSQNLVRDPNSGGAAVVRIEDPQGGREGYTFDIEWRGGNYNSGGYNNGGYNDRYDRNNGRYSNRRDDWNNPSANSRGYGNNSGNWNNNGWGRNWGDRLSFTGRGRGQLDLERGRSLRIRGADVNINRDNGRVAVNLDADNSNDLRFAGQIQRIEGDTIYADVRNGGTRGDAANAAGIMRIRVGNGNRVEAIQMDGDVQGGGRFRLNWSE